MRLDKAVTSMGLSRSQAKEAIRCGRVAVGGKTVLSSAFQLAENETVTLDGTGIDFRRHHHIMVHKPAGCLTATSDPRGERTVLDLLPTYLRYKDLGPVGRLDKDVTGLVILTTDGELAHRLISPRRDIEKQYLAKVEGELSEKVAAAFEKGIELSDFTARPAHLEILEAVKRMLGSLGHTVITLKRECIAGLWLDGDLEEGQFRALTDDETALLYEKAGLDKT